MTTPNEALRNWLNANGHTQATFSVASGFSDALISMWLSGHRRPSLASAVRLEGLTSIPAAAWLTAPPSSGSHPRNKPAPKGKQKAIPRKRATGRAA